MEKWTREACMAEARKYRSKKDFRTQSYSVYQKAWRMGWLGDYTWLTETEYPNGYWNYERTTEEARKYQTRTAFSEGSSGACSAAYRHHWIDGYTWLDSSRTKRRWTVEEAIAAGLEYPSRSAFSHGSPRAYEICRKRGLLGNIFGAKSQSEGEAGYGK